MCNLILGKCFYFEAIKDLLLMFILMFLISYKSISHVVTSTSLSEKASLFANTFPFNTMQEQPSKYSLLPSQPLKLQNA